MDLSLRAILGDILAFARARWYLLAAASLALAAVGVAALALGEVPLPSAVPAPQSTKILAADGQIVAQLHGEENRTVVALAEISPHLRDAVVATEDRTFYAHSGVSVRGILRAVFSNVRERGVRQGGSTITQQYVRNRFAEVGRERSFLRKIREAVVAVKLERRYSKDKILESYLNTVYFGRGAYGAEAAARTYFRKTAKELSVSEAAYLAGVIRSPERFQPDRSQSAPTRIRDEVVGDMVEANLLSREAADEARTQPLDFSLGASVEQESSRAAFFIEYVRRILKEEFKLSDADILSGGLEVHTTLNLRMQDAAEGAIASTLDRPDDPEAALVAMDTSGNIRAMVGGRNFSDLARARGFNFAYQRSGETGGRQPGSAFKPFTLAAFVEEGYSVSSVFTAPPTIEIASRQCQDSKGAPWKVANFDDDAFSPLTVSDATTRSVNTVYAQMIDRVTPRKVARLAERAGGWSKLEEVCSLALGTPAVSPLEMARAFATFAGRGQRPDAVAVTKIAAPGGRVLATREARKEQVLDANVADTVNGALQDVLTRGTARGKGIGRAAAGKTGTTQNHVDAWFVGYTPDLVAAVWMGFPPDPATKKIPEMTGVRGRRVTGGSFPATIWQKFMTEAVRGMKAQKFTEPRLGGEEVKPTPTPCAEESPPPTAVCLPSPSAAPSPSPGEGSPPPTPSPIPSG